MRAVSDFLVADARGAYIVQVYIDAAKVVQHEVSYRVGALDWVDIAIKGLEEPRISDRC